MAKGEFKIRNIYGFTTGQVKGKAVNYGFSNYDPIFIGTLTYADEEYIYGEFIHTGKNDIYIDFCCKDDDKIFEIIVAED